MSDKEGDEYARIHARLAALQRQLEGQVIELEAMVIALAKYAEELLRLRLACAPAPFLVKQP